MIASTSPLYETDTSGQAALGVLVFIGLACILCAFIGKAIGVSKGMPWAGFFLGLLLGPIGLIIIAVLPRTAIAEAAHQYQVQKLLERVGK